jgi:hypothetical protein
VVDHVVLVSLTRTRRDVLVDVAQRVLESGGAATFVVGVAGPWQPLPEGSQVVELLPLEERHWPTPWLFADVQPWRVPVDKAVSRGFDAVGRRLARVAREPATRLREIGWRHGIAARDGRPGRRRRWLDSEVAGHVRPWMLWRALRAHGPGAGLGAVDLVVWGDQQSWPIAWHLARRSSARVVAFYDAVAAVDTGGLS